MVSPSDVADRSAQIQSFCAARPPGTVIDRQYGIGVIRVIEDQITTLRPYNARYTGDHRSIFRKRYAEMITRISLDMRAFGPSAHALFVTVGHSRPGRGGNGM